jgi:SET domain-containing protein
MSNEYKDMHHYYFLNYSQGEVVDACQKGTKARFINHSCNPNCRIEKWTVGQEGEYRIAVFANREIAPGEELTYDYKFESFGSAQPCLCGAENCRGMIVFREKGSLQAQLHNL